MRLGALTGRLALAAGLGCGLAGSVAAQGCSQCRDTVSQTNPAQQESYRSAIGMLLAGVVTVGGASVLVMRRFGR